MRLYGEQLLPVKSNKMYRHRGNIAKFKSPRCGNSKMRHFNRVIVIIRYMNVSPPSVSLPLEQIFPLKILLHQSRIRYETTLQLIETIYRASLDNGVFVCVLSERRGRDISSEGGLPRQTVCGSAQSRRIIRHPQAAPMEDAGPRGTRTDCPRQNFLNYPAASRNNSSDSNSVVYEAGPTSPRQTNRDKMEEEDGATEQEKTSEEVAATNSRGASVSEFEDARFLQVRFRASHCDSFRRLCELPRDESHREI